MGSLGFIVNLRKLEHGFWMNAGMPASYFKSMKILMFQLPGFYFITLKL